MEIFTSRESFRRAYNRRLEVPVLALEHCSPFGIYATLLHHLTANSWDAKDQVCQVEKATPAENFSE